MNRKTTANWYINVINETLQLKLDIVRQDKRARPKHIKVKHFKYKDTYGLRERVWGMMCYVKSISNRVFPIKMVIL